MLLNEILEILKKKNSNQNAYTINGNSYSYKEFYKYVCNLYHFLLLNNPQKLPVVIYGHKDIYMKASFLACAFAGMTYIPIDKSIPNERVNLIINEVNPCFIIGNYNNNVINFFDEEAIFRIMEQENFNEIDEIFLKPEDIFYIIFTSGSTGVPKGVQVTYENLDSCVKWLKKISKVEQNDIILNQAHFSFDLSVADLYLSLVCEGEHFILEDGIKSNFQKLFYELKRSNCNIIVMTPSFADLLLLDKSFNMELLPNLKTIIFCGEKLLNKTVKKLFSNFDDIRIINTYGPTECTFAVTSIDINKDMLDEEEISIGKAKDDVEISIVDENMNCLEDGEAGEILIRGKSVAAGYLNMDSSNFITSEDGKRSYLTGDIGYIKDGLIYYKCRKDKQIKYKGYRVEISDIEKNFYKLSYIEKVIIVPQKINENKIIRLIAFVKVKNKNEFEIKNDLKKLLPNYMIPEIKIVDEIPLNKNGKCDERKLLEGV